MRGHNFINILVLIGRGLFKYDVSVFLAFLDPHTSVNNKMIIEEPLPTPLPSLMSYLNKDRDETYNILFEEIYDLNIP